MTRQQRYQRRHKEAGLCIYCPRKAVSRWFCALHLKKRRTLMRVRKGSRPWHPGGPGRPPLTRPSIRPEGWIGLSGLHFSALHVCDFSISCQ